MPRSKAQERRKPWTASEILQAFRRWEKIYGAPPTQVDWNPARARAFAAGNRQRMETFLERARRYEAGGWPSPDAVRRVFGSFNSAMVAAGYQPRPVGRQRGRKLPKGPVGIDEFDQALSVVDEAIESGSEEDLRSALLDLAGVAEAWARRL